MNTYPTPEAGPPKHRMFAIEYYCPVCRPHHQGRFFKKPDTHDLSLFKEADARWHETTPKFVPDDAIPTGDESSRLHRWGYKHYKEMFNSRQLLGLELSCEIIDREPDTRIRDALSTNLSDLLRYQNMVCRYDKMALKSLDIFSVHGFPVGLIECESNLLGVSGGQRGASIGSGGWLNIIDKFTKAKRYCDEPFEILHQGREKHVISIPGEWIGDTNKRARQTNRRRIELSCSDAIMKELQPASLDGVFTDPPYLGNVQYAELMDFCYVWLRKLANNRDSALAVASTRHVNELTANENMRRGPKNFTEGLSAVFRQMATALKPGAPLVFTYHHNAITAYYPVVVAILDAWLTCSASLPCPAEMGASIHINGTGSSIIDTIFVCRSTGKVPGRWLAENAQALALVVEEDLDKLRQGNVRIAYGDIRCIIYGHLARLAIWALRKEWDESMTTEEKLGRVADWIAGFGGLPGVEQHLNLAAEEILRSHKMIIREPEAVYRGADSQISF